MNAGEGGRGTVLLSAGTVGAGVLAYVFNVVAARALGPESYGAVAVLWASVFLVSVVLFRPVEQTLSRSIADRRARGDGVAPVVRSVLLLAAGLATAAVAGCLAAWAPITASLFGGRGALTAALAAGIAGYGASYVVRGLTGGVRAFGSYGLLLLADGGSRVALALPLVVVASAGLAGAAVALAAFAGAAAPLLRRSQRQALMTALRPPGHSRAGEPFAIHTALRFAGPVAIVGAAEQVLVSGGPLLIVAGGGTGARTAAGTVFAATMLVRAPVFLFQGLAAALLPSLTTFRAQGDERAFRRWVVLASAVLLGFGALLALAALAAGPAAMHLLYGPGFEATRIDLAVLAAGVGCYLTAATCSQAALAREQARATALVWSVSAAAFVAATLALSGAALHRVSVAFALAALIQVVLMLALVARDRTAPRRRPAAQQPPATPVGVASDTTSPPTFSEC